MNDLIELCDLGGMLSAAGVATDRNFEEIYSDLSVSSNSKLMAAVNERIGEFFWSLRLPEHPTIYDVLVLSLRPKDIIATFNWDPLLYIACLETIRLHVSLTLPTFTGTSQLVIVWNTGKRENSDRPVVFVETFISPRLYCTP
jgi:hypothetical protein